MATERKPRSGEASPEERRAQELAAFEEVVRRRNEVWAGKPILNDSAQIIREAREQRGREVQQANAER